MLSNRTNFTRLYPASGLFQLFMFCAFPIHVWALLMAFRDFSWVALRTNVWDALGLLSYSLVFAMVESLGIFLILVIAGFLMPRQIEPEKRLAFLGMAFLVVAIWAIAGQVYSWLRYPLPAWYADLLIRSQHPFRYLWGTVFALTLVSAAVPLVLISRRAGFRKMLTTVFERVSMVSSLYVFFDVIGIIIIVIRNLP